MKIPISELISQSEDDDILQLISEVAKVVLETIVVCFPELNNKLSLPIEQFNLPYDPNCEKIQICFMFNPGELNSKFNPPTSINFYVIKILFDLFELGKACAIDYQVGNTDNFQLYLNNRIDEVLNEIRKIDGNFNPKFIKQLESNTINVDKK